MSCCHVLITNLVGGIQAIMFSKQKQQAEAVNRAYSSTDPKCVPFSGTLMAESTQLFTKWAVASVKQISAILKAVEAPFA